MSYGNRSSFSPVRSTLLILTYLGLIFGTLPVVPNFVVFIKKYGPIGIIVNASISIFMTLVILITMIRSRQFRWQFALIFVPLGVITLWGLNHISLPIERVHIAEYSVLAVMIYRVCAHNANPFFAAAQSLFLASLAGCVDEGIQYFLPNRFFTLSDIYLNIAGSAVGLVYYGLYRWVRGPKD